VPAAAATIEQLARDAVRIPDPETALRALGALRRELDETESELVIRALQTGASWAHIARALGVSKQAAHRKHRHLADQLHLTPAEGGSKILVTVEARRAIQFAREETKRLGQPAIGTEHILLGILRCQQSPAVKALNALGVTHHAAKACIQPTMASGTPVGAGAVETPHEHNVTATPAAFSTGRYAKPSNARRPTSASNTCCSHYSPTHATGPSRRWKP
jgi:ATP-dependent Clp protease ATP-binding subunit ClpA